MKPSSARIAGSATFTIETSSTTMNWPRQASTMTVIAARPSGGSSVTPGAGETAALMRTGPAMVWPGVREGWSSTSSTLLMLTDRTHSDIGPRTCE